MARKIIKQDSTKAVTARFSLADYSAILEAAESRGASVADVLRDSWRAKINHNNFENSLMQMEKRLLKQIFSICAAVNGLSDEERGQAIKELRENKRPLR